MYTYQFTERARRDFKKLPKKIQQKIIKKLDYHVKSPTPLLFASALTAYCAGKHRFRIGDYRVIFDVENGSIIILTLGHRKNIYR